MTNEGAMASEYRRGAARIRSIAAPDRAPSLLRILLALMLRDSLSLLLFLTLVIRLLFSAAAASGQDQRAGEEQSPHGPPQSATLVKHFFEWMSGRTIIGAAATRTPVLEISAGRFRTCSFNLYSDASTD